MLKAQSNPWRRLPFVAAAVFLLGYVTPALAGPRIPGVVADREGQRLYVSSFAGTNDAHVFGYDILDGLVRPEPVIDYRGASGTLALGPLGELYTGNDERPAGDVSDGPSAYFRDSTHKARSFNPAPPNGCSGLIVLPMVVAGNHLFFGFKCANYAHQGIYVYELTTPTKQRLVNLIELPYTPTGLAVDDRGELYVGDFYGGEIDVFKNPITAPKEVRAIRGTTFDGNGTAPGAIWIDESGELYVFNFGVGTVSAYPHTAHGTVAPDRTINPSDYNISPWGYIAIAGNTLFMTYQVGSTFTGVAAFDKRVNGTQKPRQLISVPNIYQGLNVGP
jgi:hypothetical protein